MIGDSAELYHIGAKIANKPRALGREMYEDDRDIWAFAAGVYADSEVETACLVLQDDHRADVVLVLFLVWLGLGGRQVSAKAMETYLSLSGHWQEAAVAPLRQIRRRLKTQGGPAGETYRSVKKIELEAERAELGNFLVAANAQNFQFDLAAGSRQSALASLQTYFEGAQGGGQWPQVQESASLIVDRASDWLGRQAGK